MAPAARCAAAIAGEVEIGQRVAVDDVEVVGQPLDRAQAAGGAERLGLDARLDRHAPARAVAQERLISGAR